MYRFVEHTAELGLELEGPTEEAVFGEALVALGELIADDGSGSPAAHEVELDARDRAGLLADWLDELVYLAETEGFVPERVASLELSGSGLHARVEGREGEPRHLVKAVTHHQLTFERRGQGYRAYVVLDV